MITEALTFRPGSPEQRDPERWRELMAGLTGGASFYCHKGVPLAPGGEHGFAYPSNPAKLRLCRGYLNMLGRQWDKEFSEPASTITERHAAERRGTPA